MLNRMIGVVRAIQRACGRWKMLWYRTSPRTYNAVRGAYVRATGRLADYLSHTDTAGWISQRELGLPHGSIEYRPSQWGILRRALPENDVSPDDVFLDFGSGKGRVLVEAAHYPFARIIGVEMSEELNRVARRNLERNHRRLACRDVRAVTTDAATYDIPDDVTVVYFYNPFVGEPFKRVMMNIQASLRRRPREMRIIYQRPEMHSSVVEAGFRVVSELMPIPDQRDTFWQSDRRIAHDLLVYTNLP